MSEYTAENYTADAKAIMPHVTNALHQLGYFSTCGQCGKPHDGGAVTLQYGGHVNGEIDTIELVAVCNNCASKPLLPPKDWRHVGPSSGLFATPENWQVLTAQLRKLALEVAIRNYSGITLTTIDTNENPSAANAGANMKENAQ
jgi:hypothetical protein